MNQSKHPLDKEEVMAYLDGELPVERASAVVAHLEGCVECRALAAELRQVSERLAAWQVDSSPARLAGRVKAALDARGHEPPTRAGREALFARLSLRQPWVPRWVWPAAAVMGFVLCLVAISIPNLLRSRVAVNRAMRPEAQPYGGVSPESGLKSQVAPYSPPQPAGPMIVRTATITLLTKEFDKTRASIEDIVQKHQGYSAALTVTGQAGETRTLRATFRVPADRLDRVVTEVGKLARVAQESQRGEEVTQQYVDLVARLSNARHTEQRLIEVLRQRTGKVADILAVEQEIARVRGEIERMDAEVRNLEKQVHFATLELQLNEEYKAQLEVTAESTGRRLRNATVEGYRSAVEAAVGLVLVILRYGPSLLFWVLVFFWPARVVWQRLRS